MRKKNEQLAKNWLKKSPLARILLEKSLLNERTFEILLLFYLEENVNFEKIAKVMKMGRSGVWKRWRRGLDTIMRAFYTLELSIYAGILDVEIAELILEDLEDYVSMRRGERDIEEIRERIEKRIAILTKGLS